MEEENLKKEEEIEEQDDIVLENDAEYEQKDPQDIIVKLKSKIKQLESEKQEYLDGWQRAKADFINTRKRDEETANNFIKFSNERLISDLIPVLDSFDMAMTNKEAWEKAPKEWRLGVEYIYSQLLSIFSQNGLVQFNPIGKPFDPAHHEAVDTIETTEKLDDHKVLDVLQKGYSLNDKPIRSAKVKVGKYIEK